MDFVSSFGHFSVEKRQKHVIKGNLQCYNKLTSNCLKCSLKLNIVLKTSGNIILMYKKMDVNITYFLF